ncbi:MAG TPA: serine hydrolase [Puia sp.]|uniref:serine hydrolase n=1 Tax=Puia sp. TaxID=2045100 RepID=UPI002BE68E7E|nr:serine hydrolase [Puia sp.]HVU96426.1 serine hydrolase [Puia sp.]
MKRKSFFSLLIALSMATPITAPAQQGLREIDSFLTQMHAGGKFNGGVMIAEKGQVIYTKFCGMADIARNIPNGPDSRFDIASVSKTFTAVAILQLMEKGRLKLDDPFARYFPEFPYPAVTVRQMLTHTSGIPDEFHLFSPITDKYPDSILRNQDLIGILRSSGKPLEFTPGEHWHYCNTNFELLALLVEKLSGEPFAEYIRRHIFSPAHMNNSYIISDLRPADPQAVTRYVRPYYYSRDYVNADSVKSGRFAMNAYGGTVGDNNVVSTLGDLLKYDQALYGDVLLRPQTLRQAFAPQPLKDGSLNYDHPGDPGHPPASYGLGWFVATDSSDRKPVSAGNKSDNSTDKIVYHGGYNPGASTMIYRDLTRRRTIVFFDNTNDDHFYPTMAIAAWLDGKRPPAQWAFAFDLKRSIAREYGAELLEKGEDAALLRLLTLQKDTAHYYLSRRELSLVGYELLQAGRKDLGFAPFRANLFLFPHDAASFGNYGIVLADNGKKEEAIAVYRMALSEHPDDKTITGLLQKELGAAR